MFDNNDNYVTKSELDAAVAQCRMNVVMEVMSTLQQIEMVTIKQLPDRTEFHSTEVMKQALNQDGIQFIHWSRQEVKNARYHSERR